MLQLPKDVSGGGESQFSLVIHTPLQDVWRMFTDVERWPEYTDMFQFVKWTSREHWTTGSNFEGRMLWPFPLTMRYVVMSHRPPQEIRWLVHAIGIVIERWTRFRAQGDSTEIVTQAIYIGESTEAIPGEVGELLPQYTERLYMDFKAAFERAVRKVS